MEIEIEVENIKVTVDGAIVILANAIHQEVKEKIVSCGATSSREPHFSCSRGIGHTGRHIAGGSLNQIYDMWKDE